MAWFKLNDSLNSLKGQISNVVQEAFTENIEDDELTRQQTDAIKQIEDFKALCGSQEAEILTLKRQIQEFQQHAKSSDHPTVSKNLSDPNNASQIDESWFWSTEPTTTSSSSSKDNETISSKSGSGGDLTVIPLDGHTHHPSISAIDIDKLYRLLDEKEQNIKKIKSENTVLNEKIRHLTDDNREANENIEELDRQHGFAVERLLGMKHEIEDKHDALKIKFDEVQKQNETIVHNQNELKENYDKLEKSYITEMQEKSQLQSQIDALSLEIRQNVEQNEKLQADLEDKERFEIVKDKDIEIAALQQKLSELEKQLKEAQKSTGTDNVTEIERLQNEIATMIQKHSNDVKEINENNLKKCREIVQEKNRIEYKFFVLQEAGILLQKELNDLKKNYQSLQKECNKSREQQNELQEKYETLQKTMGDVKVQELTEEFETLKAEASESESLLIQENIILQKQVIDLKSSINGNNATGVNNSIILDELRQLVRKYIKYDGELDATKTSFEIFLKSIGEQIDQKYDNNDLKDELTLELAELNEQNQKLHDDKQKLQHEKDTIRADLHHYEVEVAQLMKNNELLLSEIEHLKTSKLETISEHNEDNIVILEQQLEDCSKLNQNLEDEYVDLRNQLQTSNDEKQQLLQKVHDLEIDLEKKIDSINKVTLQLESVEIEKSNLQFEINELKTDDTISLLKLEKEEQFAKAISLQHQLDVLNSDHSDLVGKLQSLQTTFKDYQANADTELQQKENELLEHRQLINKKTTDIKELLENVHQLQSKNDVQMELEQKIVEINLINEKLNAEHENVKRLTLENENLLKQIQDHHVNAKNEHETSEQLTKLQQSLEIASKEKSELFALITAKHNENVQYHAEIQRLDQLLKQEVQKQHICTNCPLLTQQLTDLQITVGKEMEKLNDQIVFLREKSDILTGNLLTEQNNQRRLNQEIIDLNDEKLSLAKDLNRLQEHLMQIEEAHTEETMQLQRQIEETKVKMAELEEDARKSSTLYTSASIRANQHTETLQVQYTLLVQQRDELLAKLNAAEDKESKNEAALINLQCALEQFQKNKEKDVDAQTHRLQRELESERDKQQILHNEIQSLKNQLTESKNGLLAAARLSDQLELCQVANVSLKDEARIHQEKLIIAEQKLRDIEISHADKVEKGLLKNLLIGYIVAPNPTDKSQILKLISSVLDFNQTESDKVGLNKSHVSWLTSIVNVAAGNNNNNNNAGSSSNANYNKEGLAQAFVRFLEKESQPKQNFNAVPNLLNMVQYHQPLTTPTPSPTPTTASDGSTAAVASADRKSSVSSLTNQPAAVQPILLTDTVLPNFAPPRNSSSILKDILNDS